jgi:hypothetical protein
MANQIPLIVNAGAAQIQELATADNLEISANIVAGGILTDGYYYANGTPVTFGGGSTNTGNVTFDNNAVIGTGDEYGYSGLYLAPGANSVGNAQYLRVRGGDYPTHIHLDTGDNGYFDQYFGDDGKYVKLESGGNISIGTNTHNWAFDTDGGTIFPTLTVQRGDNPGGTISGQTLLFGSANSEAIISTPDGVAGSEYSQRLVINPGAGNNYGEGGDIYLWAGRGGDGSGSGGDIKIRGGQGGANTVGGSGGDGGYIRIEAGDAATTGGNPGYIDITGGYSNTVGGYINVTGGQGATDGGDVKIYGGYGQSVGGNVNIWGGASGSGQANEGHVNIQTGGNTWIFDSLGNLTLPANTFAVNYANGDPVTISGGGANTGNVTFDDTTISTNSATAGIDVYLRGGTATGCGAIGGNSIILSGLGPYGFGSGNVEIKTGNSHANTWNFAADGKLTFPGGMFIDSPIASVSRISADPNVIVAIETSGPTSSVVLAWTDTDPGTLDQKGVDFSTNANSGSPYAEISVLNQTLSGSAQQWKFADNGSLTFPDVNNGTITGMTVTSTGEISSPDQFNFLINTSNTGNTSSWTFSADGNLTVPGNNFTITPNLYNDGTVGLVANANLTLATSGSTSFVDLFWADDIANTTEIAGIQLSGLNDGHGNILLYTYTTNGQKVWNFDNTGNLAAPGDISAVGNITSGYFVGDGSQLTNIVPTNWANIGNLTNSNGPQTIAIGAYAGEITQGSQSVAIGVSAGQDLQGDVAVAIGSGAASYNQGNYAVAIGANAGFQLQGNAAVAIGANAGDNSQGNNSIIINATGNSLNQTTANTFTVKPVRGDSTGNLVGAGFVAVYYNPTTGEFAYASS